MKNRESFLDIRYVGSIILSIFTLFMFAVFGFFYIQYIFASYSTCSQSKVKTVYVIKSTTDGLTPYINDSFIASKEAVMEKELVECDY